MANDGTAAGAASTQAGGDQATGNTATTQQANGAATGSTAATAPNGDGQQAPSDGWKQGIPSHMLKDTPEATLAEVYKGYKGFRDQQSQQGPVGKSPDD
jgi:hypothetical protein